jgi:mono/diheme cytochrome c family protein
MGAGRKRLTGDDAIMKISKLVLLVLVIAFALFLVVPNLSWADDGAALYKAKCAACHGADGAGKAAAKIPALSADDAQKKSDAELTDFIANGGPNKKASHAFAQKGLTEGQIKSLVGFVRTLKK